jgi:hypothetical protein
MLGSLARGRDLGVALSISWLVVRLRYDAHGIENHVVLLPVRPRLNTETGNQMDGSEAPTERKK